MPAVTHPVCPPGGGLPCTDQSYCLPSILFCRHTMEAQADFVQDVLEALAGSADDYFTSVEDVRRRAGTPACTPCPVLVPPAARPPLPPSCARPAGAACSPRFRHLHLVHFNLASPPPARPLQAKEQFKKLRLEAQGAGGQQGGAAPPPVLALQLQGMLLGEPAGGDDAGGSGKAAGPAA